MFRLPFDVLEAGVRSLDGSDFLGWPVLLSSSNFLPSLSALALSILSRENEFLFRPATLFLEVDPVYKSGFEYFVHITI